NEPAISKAVATSQAASYATKTLPQLNHLFQQCKQCNGNEYIALSETINPTALATVGLWLQEICTLR
ncbi:MAG TPA: alpha/beta hydrolase, partial [Chitinophagaceae bacterium]|nr:alpha/beta hydrolase [Chitinophagaceae bacterium]